MIFRPSESSKNIAEFYKRYLLTTFNTNNKRYNEQLKNELSKNKVISDGPYISMSDPYKKGKKIAELIAEGVLSKDFFDLKKFHPNDRCLYKHQEEAILKVNEGKNLIVSRTVCHGLFFAFAKSLHRCQLVIGLLMQVF